MYEQNIRLKNVIMKSSLYNEHTLIIIKKRPSSHKLHTVQTPQNITPTRYPAHTNLPNTHASSHLEH